jgi:hypothetical protein
MAGRQPRAGIVFAGVHFDHRLMLDRITEQKDYPAAPFSIVAGDIAGRGVDAARGDEYAPSLTL